MEERDNPRRKYDYSGLEEWINSNEAMSVPVGYAVEARRETVQFYCPRCRSNWSCPALTEEEKQEASELLRPMSGQRFFDVLSLFRSAGFVFEAAKRTMFHITNIPGKCHECCKPLPPKAHRLYAAAAH